MILEINPLIKKNTAVNMSSLMLPSICYSLRIKDNFHTHTKQVQEITETSLHRQIGEENIQVSEIKANKQLVCVPFIYECSFVWFMLLSFTLVGNQAVFSKILLGVFYLANIISHFPPLIRMLELLANKRADSKKRYF